MKKLIIGMLLLIPIIVILVVSLTGALVTGAYIAVENVDIYIKSADGKETPADEIMPVYLSDKGMQLIAKVYPTAANNKDVTWSVIENKPTVEVVGDEVIEVVSVDKNGYVTFKNLGEATVRVTTVEGNIKEQINLFVTSSDVMGISIEETPELMNICVGDKVPVIAKISPADAKVDQKYLKYEILSGSEFAEVDENGIVTAKKRGTVELKATLKNPPDSLAEEDRFDVIVFEVKPRDAQKAFIASEFIYIDGIEIDIASVLANADTELAVDHYTTTANAVIDGGKLRLTESFGENLKQVVLYAVDAFGNTLDEINVSFKQVNVKNTALWQKEDLSGKILLKIGGAGIYLPVETSLAGNVEVTSSNENVVYYNKDMNCIVAKASGEATISVSVNGISDKFDVKVVPAIYSIGMYFNSSDDEVGIEMKRYFGKMTYNIDDTVTDTLSFEIKYVITTDG
ncbi:MAG: Ig-like domain-containing protein, partial [Christensenellales bacterium]